MSVWAENICFWYKKGSPVLLNISFEAEKGEKVFILGPNGTGKTTLLKCLCGILKPKNGETYIDKISVSSMTPGERAKKIGYVPQMSRDVFGTEGIDMIMLGKSAGRGRRLNDEDREDVFKLKEKMKIENLLYKKINEMSGGERQRIYIAKALAQNPDVMILDEPISALDIKNQIDTMKLITDVSKERNMSIIVTVHDLNIASLFADKIMMLKDAEIYKYAYVEEVMTEDNIRSVYGIDVHRQIINGNVQIMLKK